jgi:hypothetical protein
VSVAQGGAGTTTITVAPSGGFTGAVALTASGLPAGVTASFSPATTTNTSTLALAAAATATAGAGSVTVTGASGSLSQTVTVPLTVTAAASGGGPATFSGVAQANTPWYNEDDVDLVTTAPITALTVTITIPAGDVSFNNLYNNVSGQIVQTHSTGATIVCTYTLSVGGTINPGKYTFAAQTGASGVTHNPTTDSWTATYTTAAGTFTQSGSF